MITVNFIRTNKIRATNGNNSYGDFGSVAEGIDETHTVIISGEISQVSFISSINPKHIILNRDYNLTPAILAEEKLITDTGLDLFSYAEFRSDINEMSDQDSVWLRVECHFTGPHETQPQAEYLISSDRFWRIIGDFPEELDAGGRIRYYGSESSGLAFDAGFLQYGSRQRIF